MRHKPVDLAQIMRAREERALSQQALLLRHALPLVSFSLNMPGPIKNSPLIEEGFNLALSCVENALKVHGIPVREKLISRAFTGDWALLACETDAFLLKRLMSGLEEADAFGRLLDLDVLDAGGSKIPRESLGFAPRPCLLCDKPAHLCAPSRAHSAKALYERARGIIQEAVFGANARAIGRLAQKSLLYEALVTPKPGLVDRDNSGAHQDMDIFTLMDSAAALGGYFEGAALTGMGMADAEAPLTMGTLRPLGLSAETIMFEATGGVNTHKGAIYALGIFCAAAGRLKALHVPLQAEAVLDTAGLIARDETAGIAALSQSENLTNGLRQYAASGATGARGEAAKGFPSLRQVALPQLRRYLAEGQSLNDALAYTLIHLIPAVQDTNLMKRAGPEGYPRVQNQIRALLADGPLTLESIRRLDQQFIALNLSPGGSADLLSAACLVHWLEEIPPA